MPRCLHRCGGYLLLWFLWFYLLAKEVWSDARPHVLQRTNRDEGMHTHFACLLFSHLKRCPHPDTVKLIITEAVTIEQELGSFPLSTAS